MNETIAYGIAEALVSLGIVTRATGCAKITQTNKGFDLTDRVVYIATGEGQAVCDTDAKLFSFLPNSKEKAIAYFEDKGVTVKDFGSTFQKWTGALKLFVWINTKLIDPANPVGTKRKIFDSIPLTIQTDSIIRAAKMKRVKMYGTDEKPYQGCNLDEKNKHFLTSPHDYLVVDLEYTIITTKDCLPTLEQNPVIC
jgi:hypothetical protein